MRLALDRFDERGDFVCGGSGTFSEFPHLVRDHREAAALLACASRLDRGVECQQVGLIGDLPDHLGNGTNLLRTPDQSLNSLCRFVDRTGDVLHFLGRASDDVGTLAGQVRRLPGIALRRKRDLRNFVDADRQLFDSGGGGGARIGLALRGLADLARRDRKVGRLVRNLLGASADIADDASQFLLHVAERGEQIARLVARGNDLPRQVATGEAFGLFCRPGRLAADLALNAAVDRPTENAECSTDDDQEDQRLQCGAVKFLVDVFDIDPRAQPPAPGLKRLGVGNLRDRIVGSGFGEHVIDVTLTVTSDELVPFLDVRLAVRIFGVEKVLALAFDLGAVHQVGAIEIVDEQIVRTIVEPASAQAVLGDALRVRLGELAGLGQLVLFLNHRQV